MLSFLYLYIDVLVLWIRLGRPAKSIDSDVLKIQLPKSRSISTHMFRSSNGRKRIYFYTFRRVTWWRRWSKRFRKKSKSSGIYSRPTPFQSTIYFIEIYSKNLSNFECNFGTTYRKIFKHISSKHSDAYRTSWQV